MAASNDGTHVEASLKVRSHRQSLRNLYQSLSLTSKGFCISMHTTGEEQCLILTHEKLFDSPPFGPTSRVRILVKESLEYVVHVLFREVELGVLIPDDVENQMLLLCKKYSWDSPIYRFCSGIDPSEYEKIREVIRFDIKSVRQTHEPCLRIDSVNCHVWFELPAKCRSELREATEGVKCPACVRLKCDLERQVSRTTAESPSKKIARQKSTSRARLSYMSPASQDKRKQNQQNDRKNLKKKVELYSKTELSLDDQQNDELSTITSYLENNHSEELEKLYAEGDMHGVGHIHVIRNIWNEDVGTKSELVSFQHDQKFNGNGKRSNKWSMITIRMALAVYIRSPAAYEALKSFDVLQLPCRSTLQAYTGAFLHEPGASSVCIEKQVAEFVLHCQRRIKEGKRESKKDGVLVFDEVKVVSRLMWNSRSQSLVGLSMTHEDMASIGDIFQTINADDNIVQTSHILQFLWRDLTTDFDIIGPYFTSAGPVDSKFTLSCVLETIKLFQLHNLSTSLLVCDGASSNLSLIKASHGISGVYPVDSIETDDPYAVQPFMVNPFNPPNLIFWVICPTHQLKNLINALFSSKEGGTKAFLLNGKHFGWKSISKLFDRECQRMSKGLTRMVPKLRESHVIRDSWTKLNVTPAKIMQQEKVLSELFRYVNENEQEAATDGCVNTLSYLEACSQIFEKGFLSHERIFSMDSEVLKSINQGYRFFTSWLDQTFKNELNFQLGNSTERRYLAWQTFDLLRIDVYGFHLFCDYFLAKYPGYFISPLRITGSAVETLFSQYKYSAGGKLDAANYCHSRAVSLVKQVTATHHSGKDYRDGDLAVPSLPLSKKKYTKRHL